MANARHQGQGGAPDKSATVDTGVAEAGAAPSGTEAALDATERLAQQMRESGRQAGAAAASGPAAALDESERLARQMREGGRSRRRGGLGCGGDAALGRRCRPGGAGAHHRLGAICRGDHAPDLGGEPGVAELPQLWRDARGAGAAAARQSADLPRPERQNRRHRRAHGGAPIASIVPGPRTAPGVSPVGGRFGALAPPSLPSARAAR